MTGVPPVTVTTGGPRPAPDRAGGSGRDATAIAAVTVGRAARAATATVRAVRLMAAGSVTALPRAPA